jgi:hypothetical protein
MVIGGSSCIDGKFGCPTIGELRGKVKAGGGTGMMVSDGAKGIDRPATIELDIL